MESDSSDEPVKPGSTGRGIPPSQDDTSQDESEGGRKENGEGIEGSFPTRIVVAVEQYASLALDQSMHINVIRTYIRERHPTQEAFAGSSDFNVVNELLLSKFKAIT